MLPKIRIFGSNSATKAMAAARARLARGDCPPVVPSSIHEIIHRRNKALETAIG